MEKTRSSADCGLRIAELRRARSDAPYLSREAGFCIQAGAARTVRGRLLLAWLSKTLQHAFKQPSFLA
jgi:hypothetical protein